MTKKRVWPAWAIVPLAFSISTAASAQQTGPLVRTGPEATSVRGETVATRARPELDPLGVRLGTFLVYPSLGIQETWNDNVFAVQSSSDAKSDFVTDIMPGVAIESDWANHALNLRTGADFGLYSDYTRLNYTDYFFAGDGRLDITRESALFAGGSYAREHEEPGEPDAPTDAKRPTEYDLINGFLRHVQTFGRFRGVGEATIIRLNYDKTATFTGDDASTAARDRTVFAGGYQLGYEFLPQYEAFVRADGNRRDYDDRQEVGGERVERTSDGFTAVTGIALDLGGVVFGDVYAGYLAQYFGSDFNDVGGFTAGGTMTWNVTTLTTLNARAARTIQDTTQAGSPAILRTSGGLSADHELLRNLILTAAVTVTNDNYEESNREDYYYIGGVGARYLMNRNFYGTLGYQLVRRTTDGSDSTANSFWQNLVRVGIEAQL